MPYPENFVVRLLISVAGMYAIWMGVQFIMATFVHHRPFVIDAMDIALPLAMGIAQAIVWKPKKLE